MRVFVTGATGPGLESADAGTAGVAAESAGTDPRSRPAERLSKPEQTAYLRPRMRSW